MTRTQKFFLVCAGLLLAAAVALGAVGSHALTNRFSAAAISNWQLAVQYQMVHALGLALLCWLCDRFPTAMIFRISGWLMLAGIILFCGSIYASTFIGKGFISSLAPYGGNSFMLAWLLTAIGIWRQPR